MADKSYTICKINKITSLSSNSRYSARSTGEHNLREYTPYNCDPDKQNLNKDIVALPKRLNERPISYQEAIKQSIAQAQAKGTMGKVRKNAVYGFEIVLGFTPKDGKTWQDIINENRLEEWCEDNKKWLEEKFGKENLKHLVLHMDETNPHLHALIVPINEKGRLSAKSFINGPKDCSLIQTEYAQKVGAKYGLLRGVPKSKICSSELKKQLYPDYKTMAEFKKNSIGKVLIDENDIRAKENEKDEFGHILPEYEERMIKDLQSVRFQAVSYVSSLKQQLKEELAETDKNIDKQYDELLSLQKDLEDEKKRYEEEYKKRTAALQLKEDELLKTLGILSETHKSMKDLKKDFAYFNTLNRALKNHPDVEYSKKLYKELNVLVDEQRKKDKETKEELKKFI